MATGGSLVMFTVPSNAGPPVNLTLRIKAPVWGPDLTLATGVSSVVRRQDGTTATWTWAIVTAERGVLVAQYALQAGDLTGTGPYQIAPSVAVQGGPWP